jgi:glycosyltransferase involved in cell wall biosynthesis
MRVLQIHTRYRQPGGEDGVADAELALLRSAGHTVASIRRRNSSRPSSAAVQLATYPWNPVSTRRILESARLVRPQIAHIHNTWFATSPQLLPELKRANIATVVTLHNYRLMCLNAELLRDGVPCELCVGRNPVPGVRHRCYHGSSSQSAAAAAGIISHRRLKTWSRGVDTFFALTEFSRQRFIAAGLPADRIVVEPNFVPDAGPRQLSPSSSRQISFVGRLSREKGLIQALEAWSSMGPTDFHLTVAGDGPERSSLEAASPKSVRFVGNLGRNAVDHLLRESRAVLFPSLAYEGQPLGVLEAFAAGTPVLGSELGGLGETIRPLGPDWSIRRTSGSWRTGLERLSSDDFVDEGGRKARSVYDTTYSPDHKLRRLEVNYEAAIQRAATFE